MKVHDAQKDGRECMLASDQKHRMKFTRRQSLALACCIAPSAAITAVALKHQRANTTARVSLADRRALVCLSVAEFAILQSVTEALCSAETLGFVPAKSVGVARWIEEFLRDLPKSDLRDLRAMLQFVQHVAPLAIGSTSPFTETSLDTQKRVLSSLERSPSALLRTGFSALKQLTAIGYFRHAQTWTTIGYEGPRVPSILDRSSPRPARSVAIALQDRETFDVDAVVVGAGAGGSMAAREIARSGASVLLLEEGPDHPVESFSQREDEMLPQLYQERGGRMNRDRSLLILQGRGLGGSTIHNQNLCKRIPTEVLEEWREDGLEGWEESALSSVFSQVERDLGVLRIDDLDVNPQNQLLQDGAQSLGWRHARLQHNREGCTRSGFCELGCAYDGKNNARKTLIPQAVRAGALVRVNTEVERVLHNRHEVTGVLARDKLTGRTITVHARTVVLSASAVGSAAIALRSGLPDPFGRVGRGLHVHPASVVAGIFPNEDVSAWRGIPQSVECTEWLDFHRRSDRRTWIIPAFAHPAGTAAMMPGVGSQWLAAMQQYKHMAVLTAMVHDRSSGRVSVENGRITIDYELERDDRMQLAKGLTNAAELLFAAGADRVVFPFAPARIVRSRRGLVPLTVSDVAAHNLPMTAVHPMSSMRAGSDPRKSVVNSRGEHHHVKGLFVADGGLFPTSIGGPPQIPIYTAGMKVGRNVAEFLRRL